MFKKRYRPVEAIKFMGQPSQKTLGPNIEVLLWNVFKCQKKYWLEDFKRLIHTKDLILLQEAILNSPYDSQFKKSLEHQWVMARSFKNVKTNIETGVKTGSTVAPTKHYFSASKHSEPISKTKKMLLATVYPLQGSEQSLLVVNSHLINFVSFKKFSTHLEQVFQSLAHHHGPVLLAGDFNTWNRKRLAYFNQLGEWFGLQKVTMVRKPRMNHMFKHLDHIYCRDLEIIQSKVHTNIHSSDHYPISLSVRTLNSAATK